MKNTRPNLLKLIKKEYDLSRKMEKLETQIGDKESANYYGREATTYLHVIHLMEDQEFFDDIAEIFFR